MLKIISLQKTYEDGTRALNDISFEVNKGDFVGLVGLSGSGKSTLLKCLNRTVRATSGTILFQGVDLGRLNEHELREIRRKIGMIFQQFNLIKRYSVLTNVLTGALGQLGVLRPVLGLWPEELKFRALHYLDIVGLRGKANSRVDMLSGGQQQRVAIARALMQNPALILADEPVASLDPVTAAVVMDYLGEINRKHGITLICTLHSLDLARRYASKIVALKQGIVVFDGPAEKFDSFSQERVYIHL
jgi:phosphonate transport system ATP-binding protein